MFSKELTAINDRCLEVRLDIRNVYRVHYGQTVRKMEGGDESRLQNLNRRAKCRVVLPVVPWYTHVRVTAVGVSVLSQSRDFWNKGSRLGVHGSGHRVPGTRIIVEAAAQSSMSSANLNLNLYSVTHNPKP
jgi:hypothetical protein